MERKLDESARSSEQAEVSRECALGEFADIFSEAPRGLLGTDTGFLEPSL